MIFKKNIYEREIQYKDIDDNICQYRHKRKKKKIIAKCSLIIQYLCTIVNGRIPDKPIR